MTIPDNDISVIMRAAWREHLIEWFPGASEAQLYLAWRIMRDEDDLHDDVLVAFASALSGE